MAVPYTFGTATAAIPLSQLDSNFATAITIGNTAVQLGNTVTTLNNMTLANVTISSGTVTITNVAVTTANVSGTANISTLVVTANASVAGNVTVSGNTVVTGNVTSATHILTGGTANGVVYVDTTKALTTGSALTFDGTNLGIVNANAAYLNIQSLQSYINLKSTGAYNPFINFFSSTSTLEAQIQGVAGGAALVFATGASATEQMRLTSTSLYTASGINVGIGTSSPTQRFQVEQTQNGSTWAYITNGNSGTGAASGVLFGTDQGTAGAISQNSSNAGYGTSANALRVRNLLSAPITFETGGTIKATLDSSGNLIVAGTASGLTNNNSQQITANGYLISNHVNGTSSGSVYVYFGYNGSSIGSITQNGTTGVLYNLTSDYRLKNDQQALTGAKDFIMALKPKKWQWWDGSGEGVGFVAHEFMEVAKYSGNGEKDAVDADGKPVYQSIQPSSSEVMANLVAFIQEQQAIIQSLTDRIAALEGA